MIATDTTAAAVRSPILTAEDLRRVAPSIFAERARPGVSSRYTFVSTAEVVDLLRGEGWEPVRVSEQRVRTEERRGFQMHEIRFARRAELEAQNFHVGSTRPEMIVQNSHDGTRAYRIDAGLYRLICRNGLTVADTAFAHVAIRHSSAVEKFAEAARRVADSTPLVLDAVGRWQTKQLSPVVREEFASRALALRWDAGSPVTRLLTPSRLLRPVRHGDQGTDLWTTFNVIQEHLTRGGDRYSGLVPASADEATPSRFLRNTTRPVGGLQEGQKLNKALWTLAEEFSRN